MLYTDDTKLKDLTVGQLKDVILEVLLRNPILQNVTYYYNDGYAFKAPDNENPNNLPKGPIC